MFKRMRMYVLVIWQVIKIQLKWEEILHWNNFHLQKVENSTPSRSYRSLKVSWNRNEKQKWTKLWNRERAEKIVVDKTQFSSHI